MCTRTLLNIIRLLPFLTRCEKVWVDNHLPTFQRNVINSWSWCQQVCPKSWQSSATTQDIISLIQYINTGSFISPWNMLENWLMPQLNEDSNDYIFQQDGSPAHHKDVWGYLNRNLPQRWIGRTGKEDDALMRWPPRSPDLTPCELFLLSVCEGHCLCASTPR